MSGVKYRFRHVVEYVLVRALAFLLRVLPYRAALTIGWGVAQLAWVLARSRVREARRRIRLVLGPGLSEREVRRIAWLSLRNIAFTAVDLVRLGGVTRQWVNDRMDSGSTAAFLKAHQATGKGAILAVPHMGAWDMACVVGLHHGIPIFSVAAQQKNPLTDAYINHLRGAPGVETLARGSGAMKQVLRRLRAGGFLAILPDVRMRTEGVLVPFLGGEANIGSGMALFARIADVPVIPGYVSRIGWSYHRFDRLEPVWPDASVPKDADVVRMTAQVMAQIETVIRRQPEQWFWYNKRWVLDPLT